METAEVGGASALRVAKAVALLLCGASAHVWLGGGSASPTQVAAPPAARVAAVQAQHAAAGTSGSAAQTLAIISTVGSAVQVKLEAREQSPAVGKQAGLRAVLGIIAAPVQAAEVDEAVTRERVQIPEALPAVLTSAELEPAALAPEPVEEVEEKGNSNTPAAEPVGTLLETPPEPESTTPAAESISDERLVTDVLQQYRLAYERLDVTATQHIWPSVDARALSSAFRQLAGQRLTFQSCGVSLSGSGAGATARCQGRAEYIPKVGGRRPYVADAEWVFDLAKRDADWQITRASATVK